MKEIKCPKCGEVFTIDESAYAQIVDQVRTEELEKEIKAREAALKDKFVADLKLEKEKNASDLQKKLAEKDSLIIKMKAELDQAEESKKNAVALELAKKDNEITKLKGEINSVSQKVQLEVAKAVAEEQKKTNDLELKNRELSGKLELKEEQYKGEKKAIEDKYLAMIRIKDDEVAHYKDLKAKLSTKAIGESLEQYCFNEFNKIRAQVYPYAYFDKDNDIVDGTKGDFVFRNKDENGTEYLSIMFEMKNEADETKTKHKNEDFFKKLDEDRKKKNCEYAVLVSLLDQENELYNSGIVDVSYAYPNMFVVRPQFFLPLIGLLDKASRKNAYALARIEEEKKQSLDVDNFEAKLKEFQDGFAKNFASAVTHYDNAIKEIDNSIAKLNKVRDELETSRNQLRLANNKAQDLSIKKLTKNSPILAAKFDAIDVKTDDK